MTFHRIYKSKLTFTFPVFATVFNLTVISCILVIAMCEHLCKWHMPYARQYNLTDGLQLISVRWWNLQFNFKIYADSSIHFKWKSESFKSKIIYIGNVVMAFFFVCKLICPSGNAIKIEIKVHTSKRKIRKKYY